MFKKLLVTLVAFLLAGACVLAAGAAAEPATGVRPIEADSPCPAVGCASGSCHGFDDVPEPDGVHEMTCRSLLLERGVPCVGHAGHALLPGVRREPEPVGACARGLGRGPCADRAEGGVMPYG